MPHENPHNATRITYAIGKVEVPCVTRFAEGHVLSAAEASSLNQLVQENTRNNLHQRWKREDEQGTGKSVAERVAEATAYQNAYEFGGRKTGRTASAVQDPVRAEALNIMIRMIKNQLQAQNKPIKGKTEAIGKQANALLDSDKAFVQNVWEQARSYVAKMQEIGSEGLGDFSLDDGTETVTDAGETPAA